MHITVIDNERILAKEISKRLKSFGYSVSTFYGYQDFVMHHAIDSDLYLVDLSLGDGDGFDIIKWLRKTKASTSPIMIISGYGDNERIIYGLGIGADDYMIKPFLPNMLVARIQALLRRPKALTQDPELHYGSIEFNIFTREIRLKNELIHVTYKESLILELFLRHIGHVISRDILIDQIWGGDTCTSDNTINATLSKLRKKLKDTLQIKTIYNKGYILDKLIK